jgi:hypothetical protein
VGSESGERAALIERKVIGVFGNKQHGKDTTAHLIADVLRERGKRVTCFALADPLKQVAVHLLGMPESIAWGGEDVALREAERIAWVKYGKNAREWLQWLGTELGRDQINPEIWIDRAVDTVVSDSQGHEFFVVTDCRFHNERTDLRTKLTQRFAQFIPIRVYRPGIPVDTNHPSEAEVASMTADMFNEVIDNDSDLDGLRTRVEQFVTDVLGVSGGVA